MPQKTIKWYKYSSLTLNQENLNGKRVLSTARFYQSASTQFQTGLIIVIVSVPENCVVFTS